MNVEPSEKTFSVHKLMALVARFSGLIATSSHCSMTSVATADFRSRNIGESLRR